MKGLKWAVKQLEERQYHGDREVHVKVQVKVLVKVQNK